MSTHSRAAARQSRLASRLLLRDAVLDLVGGLHVATLYRWIAAGYFPRPVILSRGKGKHPARVAWREDEVQAWLEARTAERDEAAR